MSLRNRQLRRSIAPVLQRWVEQLEERRLLSVAGTLDKSFSENGAAAISFTGLLGVAWGTAIQPDGKTVVVGESVRDFAVARFNLDGTPDKTFGPYQDGTTIAHAGEWDLNSGARAVAIQSDGKIVVVGYSNNGDNATVMRFTADGWPDKTFDDDGKRSIDFGLTSGLSVLSAVAIQLDGKIVVVGKTRSGLFDPNDDMTVARLNTNGSLDASFDFDGVKSIDFGKDEHAFGVAIDYSGTPATNPRYGGIVLAGSYDDKAFAVVRLSPIGFTDDSFDSDGKLSTTFPGKAFVKYDAGDVVIDSAGRIVVAGTVGSSYSSLDHDFALARYLPNGALDTNFGVPNGGGTGRVVTDLGGNDDAYGIAFSKDDEKLMVAGGSSKQFAVVKYATSGLRDGLFGNNGISLTGIGGGAIATDIAAGPGRRFVAVGGGGFNTVRYLDSGANIVYATPLIDPTGAETGANKASFLVYRLENLPAPTRVYFSISGTATAPFIKAVDGKTYDYTLEGLTIPFNRITQTNGTPYVDIPAGQTFTAVYITPIDDTFVEGGERALFNVKPDPNYEVGTPQTADLFIRDNDGGSISGVVFEDRDGDGNQNSTEPGIFGRSIYIDANNNGIYDTGDTATGTDVLGNYTLRGLLPGTYVVREIVPSQWAQTSPPGNGEISAALSLGLDLVITSFGTQHQIGSIAGKVYNDANGNSRYDTGEAGIPGRKVYIDSNNNSSLDTGEQSIVTDTSGEYALLGLSAGTYKVRQVVPTGWTQTYPASNLALNVTITPGEMVAGENFFVKQNPPTGSISGAVFNDANGNAVKDSTEVGISGRTVYLDKNNNSALDSGELSAATSSSGNYIISNLVAGTYAVREVVPSGWSQTLPASNGAISVTLTSGQNVSGKNFGTKQNTITITGSISGAVYNDINGNGSLQSGETGIAGRTVFIDANGNNNLESTETRVTTNSSGGYTFSNLAAGTFKVREVVPSGWTQTLSTSNASISVTLTAGLKVIGKNFLTKPNPAGTGAISGTVYNDINGGGTLNTGETGIAGRTIFIDLNSNNALDTNEQRVITNSGGAYTFANLGVGTIKVRELVPGGWTQASPSSNASISVALTAGLKATGKNFFTKPNAGGTGAISGIVYNDLNGNGALNTGEPGVGGRVVFIDLNGNNTLDTNEVRVVTTSTGAYSITNVGTGNLKVHQVIPSGWTQTSPASNASISLTLAAGQKVTGKNFFARQTNASIAGNVFQDLNRNSANDSGEGNLSGWTVYIDTNNNNVLDSTEARVTTDSSGNYKLSNLAAGTYKVRLVPKSGYALTLGGGGISAAVTAGQALTGRNFGADN